MKESMNLRKMTCEVSTHACDLNIFSSLMYSCLHNYNYATVLQISLHIIKYDPMYNRPFYFERKYLVYKRSRLDAKIVYFHIDSFTNTPKYFMNVLWI